MIQTSEDTAVRIDSLNAWIPVSWSLSRKGLGVIYGPSAQSHVMYEENLHRPRRKTREQLRKTVNNGYMYVTVFVRPAAPVEYINLNLKLS